MSFEIETIRRFKIGIAGLFCALAFVGLSPSQAQARYASIVVDAGTGEVLHQVNADTRNYPASLTKMMTLYLAFEALDRGRLKMDQTLPVSRRAAGISPSKLGLRRGQSIKVKDAILALVTKSANDAAVVIAEALAGSEIKFAQKMTAKAKALGMTRTNFRNASGLPNRRQLSTARDMARLAQALIEDYPQFYTYFSTEKFTYKGRTYSNHNSLLRRYAGTDGLKTGYTRASGFNLAASSLRDGRRLIAVVFGGKTASSRDRHITGLLDKGFASPTMTRPLTARAGPAVAPPPRKPASLAAVPTPMHKPENLIAGSAAGATARTTAVLVAPRKKPELKKPVEVALQPWGVQVGAFYDASPAKRAAAKVAQRFPDLLGETLIMTPTIKGRRGDIYRARLMGLSEERARNACKRLRSARIDCLVVRSRETIKVALN
jgi:D-alanyl-D-alanine carboxypeptidase